jgi:hypothetical protein
MILIRKEKGKRMTAAMFLIRVLAAVSLGCIGLYEASDRPRMAPFEPWQRLARLTCGPEIKP